MQVSAAASSLVFLFALPYYCFSSFLFSFFFYYHSISHVAFLLCRKKKRRKAKLSNKTKQKKKKQRQFTRKKKKKQRCHALNRVLHRKKGSSFHSRKKKKKLLSFFPHSFCLPLCYPTQSHPNCKGLLSPWTLYFFFFFYHSLSCAASFSILLWWEFFFLLFYSTEVVMVGRTVWLITTSFYMRACIFVCVCLSFTGASWKAPAIWSKRGMDPHKHTPTHTPVPVKKEGRGKPAVWKERHAAVFNAKSLQKRLKKKKRERTVARFINNI